MVIFIGEYTVRVDDKGRIVFPAQFKSIMPVNSDMRFVVKKNLFDPCLDVYTFEEWERKSKELNEGPGKRFDEFNNRHARFWRQYTRDRAIVEPDVKLGRISIPKQLLEEIGVSKEVVFSGCDYKIEIWAKEKFEASKLSNEEFLAIADELSNSR